MKSEEFGGRPYTSRNPESFQAAGFPFELDVVYGP